MGIRMSRYIPVCYKKQKTGKGCLYPCAALGVGQCCLDVFHPSCLPPIKLNFGIQLDWRAATTGILLLYVIVNMDCQFVQTAKKPRCVTQSFFDRVPSEHKSVLNCSNCCLGILFIERICRISKRPSIQKRNGGITETEHSKAPTKNSVFFFGGKHSFILMRTFRPSIIELLCHYISGINQ